jgi:glyoxylase-like metal-dependent hydrolase (beta-lactamase superfamily II)
MKFIRWAGVVLLAVLAGACTQTPPETQAIQDAAVALGGAERIQAVRSLVIEGEGVAGNIGQNVLPDDKLQNWTVTEYKRSMDLVNGRWAMQQLRTPTFPYAPGPFQRQNQGLDGDVAWNVGGPQNAAIRASAMTARDRRVEALHHPLTAIRAALDPTSKISNFRNEGLLQVFDVTTAKGDTITLGIDRTTHLPQHIRSTAYHPNLGDVVIQTTSADYADAGGFNLPKHITTRQDQDIVLDLNVSATTVDADVGDLAAPAEVVAAAEPPMLPVYEIVPQPLAKGIWLLPGSHNSVVFEFADHLTLLEVPLNESRAQAVIAAAKALVPAKPLTHVIVTHHHFDHSGGLRAAVAEGLTIIADRNMESFIDRMVERPHTIVQDTLAKDPKVAKIDSVEDQMMLKDDAMEVRLYHVKNLDHAGTMLMAFVPSEGLLINSDLYGPGFATFPAWDTMLANIAERGLKVDKHLPIHGPLQTAKDAADTVAAKTAKPAG